MTDFNNNFYSSNSANTKDGASDCDAFWEMLSAYADDLLEGDDTLRVEKHVAACDACALDLRFMRETSVLLANTPDVAPPPGLQQAILAATIYRPTWQQRLRDSIRYWLLPARSLTFAGSAAAIVAVAFLSYRALAPMNDILPTQPTASHPEVTGSASGTDPLVAKNNASAPISMKVTIPVKAAGGSTIVANSSPVVPKNGSMTASRSGSDIPISTPVEAVQITSAGSMQTGPRTKPFAGVNIPKPNPLQRHTPPLKTGPMLARSTPSTTPVPDMMTHKDEMPIVEPAMMMTEIKKMPDKMMDMMDTTRATMPPTPSRDIASAAPMAMSKTVALTVKPETTGMRLDSIASLRAELRRKNETPRTIAVDMGSASHSELLNLVKSSF